MAVKPNTSPRLEAVLQPLRSLHLGMLCSYLQSTTSLNPIQAALPCLRDNTIENQKQSRRPREIFPS